MVNINRLKKISLRTFIIISCFFMFPIFVYAGWYGHKYYMYRKFRLGIGKKEFSKLDSYTKPIDLK